MGRCLPPRDPGLLVQLFVTPDGGRFVKSVDTSGHFKTAEYQAQLLLSVIETNGSSAEEVVNVCTDSGGGCALAGKLVQFKHPHIFWTPCAAHCMDLLLEDIGKMEFAVRPIKMGRNIVNYIRNHQWSLALIRSKSHSKHGSNKELLNPGAGLLDEKTNACIVVGYTLLLTACVSIRCDNESMHG